jgi:hypothetical protein
MNTALATLASLITSRDEDYADDDENKPKNKNINENENKNKNELINHNVDRSPAAVK